MWYVLLGTEKLRSIFSFFSLIFSLKYCISPGITWYKIKYGSGYGYVSVDYIKTSSSSSKKLKNLNGFLFVGDSFTYNIRKNIYANARPILLIASA